MSEMAVSLFILIGLALLQTGFSLGNGELYISYCLGSKKRFVSVLSTCINNAVS